MFLGPDQPISKHGNKLPHWQQGQALVFVTWRLADSIPHYLLASWKAMREVWLQLHPPPWTEAIEDEYHQRFSQQVEDWLDTGIGSCVLKHQALNGMVANALQHFEGERYQLESLVIMPNHVHVIFQPKEGHKMESIIQSWKGFTAREINRRLEKSGTLWQGGYWDRILRNPEHLYRCREYIRDNPAKARLREGKYAFWERAASS